MLPTKRRLKNKYHLCSFPRFLQSEIALVGTCPDNSLATKAFISSMRVAVDAMHLVAFEAALGVVGRGTEAVIA